MSEKGKCLISFFGKIYLLLNILYIIFLCVYLNRKNFSGGCFEDMITTSDLNPIYDIYLSDEKTEERIKLGDLAEYSNDNIKISSKEIYKWKNKYMNVKRIENYSSEKSTVKPINYIFFSQSPVENSDFNTKSLKFDDNNYLFYSTEGKGTLIYDLKISYIQNHPYPNFSKKSNICFSHNCRVNNGECKNWNNFEKIDSDTSTNLKNYNNIQIEYKNNIDLFIPETYYLYKRILIPNNSIKNNVLLLKKLNIPFHVLILLLLISKFIFACFLKIKPNECCCNKFRLIFLFIDIINSALELTMTFISVEKDKINYLDGTNYSEILQVFLTIFSLEILFIGPCSNYKSFLKKPNYCSCCNSNDDEYSNEIENKTKKINQILENIQKMKNEINFINLEKEKKEKELEDIILKMRKINVNNEKITYSLYLKSSYEIKINIYNDIENELGKIKEILQKRKIILEKLENLYKKEIFKEEINDILEGNKLKINLIYFDKNINAFEEYNSSYEFFKFLKNSIEGVFFGIKTVEDLNFVNIQLPNDFKFILIYSGDDDDFNFFEKYHNKFSDILIFTIDPDEIIELRKIENIRCIENDYYSLLLKLKNIMVTYNEELSNKFKPYNLNLYSDYISNKNIKKCHIELLKNTSLYNYTNLENCKGELLKGLNEDEYDNFISFLDDLEEITDKPTPEKEINTDEIKIDENDDNKKCVIEIIEKEVNNNENDNFEPNISIDYNFDPNVRLDKNIEPNVRRDNLNIFEEGEPNVRLNRKNENELNCDSKDNLTIKIKAKKKKLIGKIDKNCKELIKEFLLNNDYGQSKNILKLYTSNEEDFYTIINQWLFSFNYLIYKEIGPIVGKLINFLYSLIITKRKKNPYKLYRAIIIKKADIFLYKACEGDIFFYPAFTSTTTNSIVTNIFKHNDPISMKELGEKCNCEIELDYKLNETDVFQEAEIKEFSMFKKEDERLFPPFSFFRIKKVLFNDGILNGKLRKENEIYDGTFKNPFKIELEIIKRDFYLDKAIIDGENIDYIKNKNEWKKNISDRLSEIID